MTLYEQLQKWFYMVNANYSLLWKFMKCKKNCENATFQLERDEFSLMENDSSFFFVIF